MQLSYKASFILILCYLQLFIIGCFSGATKNNGSSTLTAKDKDKGPNDNRKVVMSSNIDLTGEGKKLKTTQILGDFRYVVLETLPESLLGSIGKILVNDQRIFVLDYKISKAIFVFSIKGKFIYKIVPKKSDFYTISDICIVEDNLYVLSDATVQKYSVGDGKLIEIFNLPFKALSFVPVKSEGKIFNFFVNVKQSMGTGANPSFKFFTLDLNKRKILKEQIKATNRDSAKLALFNFFQAKNEVFFSRTDVQTLFEVKSDSIIPILELKFRKNDKLKENTNHSMICNFMATPKFYYCSRVDKGKLYHIYINRENKAAVKLGSIIDNQFIGSFNSTPVGASGNDFIFSIDPAILLYNLKKHIDKGDSLSVAKLFNEALMLGGKVKRTDNPILVFATPKLHE